MAIPIAYNLRNLRVRKTTTVMTAVGIALTVAVLVADLALVNGLLTAFKAAGNPLDVLVLRKGSNSELIGNVSRTAFQDLKFKPGIARTESGEPMASLEIISVINLPSVDSPQGMNVTLRGLERLGIDMRHVGLAQGRWFQKGQREIVVGKSVVKRYPAAQMGQRLHFGRGDWEIVGVFDAGEAATNSEIWGDANQVASDFNRQDNLSSVLVRAHDTAAVTALINSINDDPRLGLSAITEQSYFETQT